MKIKQNDNGILELDDATILWPNFSGHGSKYNAEGSRNFNVSFDGVDRDVIDELKEKYGWNIRVKPHKDDPDKDYVTMKVNVGYKYKPPQIILYTGKRAKELTERNVGKLDDIDIERVCMDIRPKEWEKGITAYLQSMRVWQRESRFDKYDEEYDFNDDVDDEDPF